MHTYIHVCALTLTVSDTQPQQIN